MEQRGSGRAAEGGDCDPAPHVDEELKRRVMGGGWPTPPVCPQGLAGALPRP